MSPSESCRPAGPVPRWLALSVAIAALYQVSTPAVAQAAATDLTVRSASVTLEQGSTWLPFSVERSGDTSLAASFRYRTRDGSARAGRDYRPSFGVATVPAGASSVLLPVEVLGQPEGERQASRLLLEVMGAFAVPSTDVLSFGPASQRSDGGAFVSGMVAADFNGDGRVDLALSNTSTGTLDVMLNGTAEGDTVARWGKRTRLPSVGFYNKPASCDLNNDGKPDLLAADANTNRLGVHLNTTARRAATPSFTRQEVLSLDWGFMGQVACADIDGDGRLDIVGAGTGSPAAARTNRLIVFRNLTPAGAAALTLAPPVAFAAHPRDVFSRPSTIAVADFNGDGRPDVALGNSTSRDVTVLLNTTPAGAQALSFAQPVAWKTFEPASDMVAVDLNADGRTDLVTVNGGDFAGGATWSLLINKTADGATVPAFTSRLRLVGGTPYAVTSADMDLDGRPDLLVSYLATGDSAEGSVGVLLNRSTAGTDDPSFLLLASQLIGVDEPHSVVAVDFNQDGLPDIVSADAVALPRMVSVAQTRSVQALTINWGAAGRLHP